MPDLNVHPDVYLVAKTQTDVREIADYLRSVGGGAQLARWAEQQGDGPNYGAVNLVELMGRMCYRSFDTGLNPNVKRIRQDQSAYIASIIASKHGSVLEHANFTFVFKDVSRVFTHELVRHRAGTAISQESMRFVRLDNIPMWLPGWAQEDQELRDRCSEMAEMMEEHQRWMADHFRLDDEGVNFEEKKHKTSFMRRFAPDGVATTIGWTANARTLRHVIEVRTAPSAEEEIRLVFDTVAEMLVNDVPHLFADFTRQADGQWLPQHSKI